MTKINYKKKLFNYMTNRYKLIAFEKINKLNVTLNDKVPS